MVVEIDDSMRCVVAAWVPGLPKTKGSMEHVGNGHMREGVAGSTRWRILMVERLIAATASSTTRPIIPAGVRVNVAAVFHLPVDPVSVGSGDFDKLLRNVFDALSAHDRKCAPSCRKHAGIYADDVQVVSANGSSKVRAGRRGPGVEIVICSVGA